MAKDITLHNEFSVLDEIEKKLSFREDPDAKKAKDSFQFFIEKVAKFKTKSFHESLISRLESMVVKKHSGVRHLVVEWPRGFGKSSIVSTFFPTWLVARNRNIRIINATNALRLSVEWLRQIENILSTNFLYRNWFGNMVPDPRSLTWTDTEKIVLGRSPTATHTTFYALGVGGSTLGKRAEVILVDDIIEPQEGILTDLQIERIRMWFFNILYPILEPDGLIIVIGTRFGRGDLYEELVEKLGWPSEIISALDDKGESNWPERFTTRNLMERRENMGSIFFNLQYMNSVEGLSGNLFNEEWLRYYHDIPENIRKLEGISVYMGVDPVATSKKTSDYFCIATIAYSLTERKSYLLDILHTKASPLHQMELLEQQASIWNPTLIAVETNAMQVLFKDLLQRDTPLPIKGVLSTTSKENRFIKMSSMFESGKVLLPIDNESMRPFISEWNAFPRGKNDDVLDAVDKALSLVPSNAPPAFSKDMEFNVPVYNAKERSFSIFR